MHAKTHIINVKDYHDKTTENVPTVINYNKVVPSYIPYLQRSMDVITKVYTSLMHSFMLMHSLISFIKNKEENKNSTNELYDQRQELIPDLPQNALTITDLRSNQQHNIAEVPITESVKTQHGQNDDNGREKVQIQNTESRQPSKTGVPITDDSVDSGDSSNSSDSHDQQGDRGQNVESTTSDDSNADYYGSLNRKLSSNSSLWNINKQDIPDDPLNDFFIDDNWYLLEN
jgi:hypothetical protein